MRGDEEDTTKTAAHTYPRELMVTAATAVEGTNPKNHQTSCYFAFLDSTEVTET